MRPIELTDTEARIIQLAFEVVESAWEMQRLQGNIAAPSSGAQTAMDTIRGKIADAGTPAWKGALPPGEEDDDGFHISGSARGD